MQVFKITGKPAGRYIDAGFSGYIVKRDSDDVIEEYVEEPYFVISYIKGLYINENQLIFLKMSNKGYPQAICYDFPNINEQGFWSDFDFNWWFFYNGQYEGLATVQLEEIESETEKKEWARVASEIFKEEAAKTTGANWRLIKDLQSLTVLLDENSWRYPRKRWN